jgi:predicted Zn-dependent protease
MMRALDVMTVRGRTAAMARNSTDRWFLRVDATRTIDD